MSRSRWRARRWLTSGGAALALLGCAERELVTWEDAAPTQATLRPATPPARSPRVSSGQQATLDPRAALDRRAATTTAAGQPPAPAGATIDRALVRFRAERAAAASLPRTSARHGQLWLDVLDEIDVACLAAPTAEDLGAFVRARVTLEVERQLDLERRRLLPVQLDERIFKALKGVDARVDELRMSGALGPRKPPPPLTEGAGGRREPLSPMVVTSAFGVRQDPVHGRPRFHAGVDLGAPEGTMVYAAAPGVVLYAAWQGGFGRHIVIDHGYGVRTHYSHLSALFVKAGEIIDTGDTLGAVGASGRATGPHLHFAVSDASGGYVDPMGLLGVPLGPEPDGPAAGTPPARVTLRRR